MALNQFETTEYLGEAIQRSTDQFRNLPVFTKYLNLLLKEDQDLLNVFKELQQNRSIDTASGINLDIIGDIVGRQRTSISISGFTFFGFQGATQVGSMGDYNSPSIGSPFWTYNDPKSGFTTMTDSDYKFFIRAKIVANNTKATPEEFIQYIKFVFNAPLVQIQEGDGHVVVGVGRKLSDYEKALIAYTPPYGQMGLIVKPAGVRVDFQDFPTDFFSFQGVPGGKGLGNLGDTSVGGYFADIF